MSPLHDGTPVSRAVVRPETKNAPDGACFEVGMPARVYTRTGAAGLYRFYQLPRAGVR